MKQTLPDIETARRKYNKYVEAGLKLNPPFKGFTMEQLWFAMEEPELFKLLFIKEAHCASVDDFLEYEGHKEELLDVIVGSLGLSRFDALRLLRMVLPITYGIACAVSNGSIHFTISECARYLGIQMRALLMYLHTESDARVNYIPSESTGPVGSLASYFDEGKAALALLPKDRILQALIRQSQLLRSLHESPRYVRDEEWEELDGLAKDGFGVTREALEQQFSGLTPSDTRLLLLKKLGFSVSASAVLLGISPASVTKARQRLKAKLHICNVDSFVAAL